MQLTSHLVAIASLPDTITLCVATELWHCLDKADAYVATLRFELVYRVEQQHGQPAAMEWLMQVVAEGTARRYMSIARSTAPCRAEMIERGEGLGVGAWAELATASPERQHEVATLALEYGLPVVSIRAAVRGTDEREAMLSSAFGRWQSAFDILRNEARYAEMMRNVMRFTCE